MQGLDFPRRKGILGPSSILILLILPLSDLPYASGSCEFASSLAGEWYLQGKPAPININATAFGERTCVERSDNSYIVYSENCYYCMNINVRHENVIQYREAWCFQKQSDLDSMCSHIRSDDPLHFMFRINFKPISCPFSGSSFTFTYDKGKKECTSPVSLAERCTDESKLLLKYQACADVEGTESDTEEIQCLAVWNDGRNKYFVGTLKGRAILGSGIAFRCFMYEEKTHHQQKPVYLLAQSGDSTCTGLSTVSDGSLTIKLTKVDKEHNRCKYPSWITEHHDWHSLDGTKVYHFTNKNSTLKIRQQESVGDGFHEEKIVCHNFEKSYPNDNTQRQKVKLVAHVTSGCDVGYVCMIFHKRDHHVIEIQQSDQKAIMPEEACSLWDPSEMPYNTLISSSLRQRKCPNPGRYVTVDAAQFLPSTTSRRQRRSGKRISRAAKRRTWQEEAHHHHHRDGDGEEEEEQEQQLHEEECKSTSIQIGCSSPNQTEMIIEKSCVGEDTAFYCHGSWEERGTWYTIVSQKSTQVTVGLGQTFCFSMRFALRSSIADRTYGKNSRSKFLEQEIWLSKPERVCRREPLEQRESSPDESTYRLASQGVCEDVTKAASSLAALISISRLWITLSLACCAVQKLLLR